MPSPSQSRRLRALLASPLAVAALGTGLVGGPAGTSAHAAACPHAEARVTHAKAGTTPAYTAVRGCIASFDGTPIVYNLFTPATAGAKHPAYAILVGHGWGGSGDTTPDANLVRAGYAELTWDARGFGQSGGVAEVDSPESEGRDVSALIDDVLAPRADIARDTNRHSSSYRQPAGGMLGVGRRPCGARATRPDPAGAGHGGHVVQPERGAGQPDRDQEGRPEDDGQADRVLRRPRVVPDG